MTSIQDPEARGTMIFAWWMACLSDAFSSAYYRHKPVLYVYLLSMLRLAPAYSTGFRDDDDYDIDFYTAEPVPQEIPDSSTPVPSPREQLEVNKQCYYLRVSILTHLSFRLFVVLGKLQIEVAMVLIY
jgi:hypothetical protein